MRLLIVFLLLFSLGHKTKGQVLYGFKGGLNFSKAKFEQAETDLTLKVNVGFLLQTNLADKVFVRPEFLFSQKGWRVKDDPLNNNVTMTINYLNFPLLVGYKLNRTFSFLTGAELGYKLNAKRKPMDSWTDPYEKFDYGFCLGINYQLSKVPSVELFGKPCLSFILFINCFIMQRCC